MGKYDDLTADLQPSSSGTGGRFDDLLSDLPPVQKQPDWISKVYHPVIEGGAMTLGGLAAVPLDPETLGLASVAGGAAMYPPAKKFADSIDRFRGMQPTDTSLGQDVKTGIEGEVGGRAIGAAIGGLKESASDMAQSAGRRALGYTKRMIKKPGQLEAANSVAQTMLDKGVIKNPITNPFSSGASDMLERTQDLSETSGDAITKGLQALDKAGVPSFDTRNVAKEVYSQLKPQYSGGAYDAQNKIAQEIADTVMAHGNGPVSFQSAQDLKNTLQDLGKFNSSTDQLKAKMYQRASGIVRKALDDSVENAPISNAQISPDTFGNYLDAKKTYGASKGAEKALLNRVSSEQGNRRVGLTDVIAGGAELARGNPLGAAGLVGLKHAVETAGDATMATIFNQLSKANLPLSTIRMALTSYLNSRNSGPNEGQ